MCVGVGLSFSWDIRSTPLGDALYNAHVLDYDLVRQVREQVSRMTIWPGVWDADFIGESQHATATHVVTATSCSEKVEILRSNIRSFRQDAAADGHITVIWSASVERPSELELLEIQDLFDAIERSDPEVSPSMLYATAALLEGCSFVNGGSQNTLCPALYKLAVEKGVYILGTDFKAGQTKFKTCAVEYFRQNGLRPTVIASSNHLGNNDMLNLTSQATLKAKMRVKHDIFSPWEEDIDHQVRVMYTPFMGDDKRDIVEYTSLGFLNAPHTMLTYTRCMDSILCVPLMIDSAVWCDHFHRHRTPLDQVSKALAYLFKLPEGGAKGADPGFFHQMRTLDKVLEELTSGDARTSLEIAAAGTSPGPLVVCAGLCCLDMQLLDTSNDGKEAINRFAGSAYHAGGAAPQAATAFMKLGFRSAVICKVGRDAHASQLAELLQANGVALDWMIADPAVQTSLSILPIYRDGGRGCFVNLAANEALTVADVLRQYKALVEAASSQPRSRETAVGAFHFGYPHLLPNIQGEQLKALFKEIRRITPGAIRSLDVNGVNAAPDVLSAALPLVDVFHCNVDEAAILTGLARAEHEETIMYARRLAKALLADDDSGPAVVLLTCGGEGATLAAGTQSRLERASSALQSRASGWAGECVHAEALKVGEGSSVNANGAGDASVAGLVAALLSPDESGGVPLSPATALKISLYSALHATDSALRSARNSRLDVPSLRLQLAA